MDCGRQDRRASIGPRRFAGLLPGQRGDVPQRAPELPGKWQMRSSSHPQLNSTLPRMGTRRGLTELRAGCSGHLGALLQRSPPCPPPEHVGSWRREGLRNTPPCPKPAQLGPEATCGPSAGVGVVLHFLEMVHLLFHLHPLPCDPEGLQLWSGCVCRPKGLEGLGLP